MHLSTYIQTDIHNKYKCSYKYKTFSSDKCTNTHTRMYTTPRACVSCQDRVCGLPEGNCLNYATLTAPP